MRIQSRRVNRESKIVNGTSRWKIVVARGWFLLNLIIFVCLGSARAQTVIPFVDEIIIDPQTHQKLTAEPKQCAAENAELRSRLDRLEKMILDSTENK